MRLRKSVEISVPLVFTLPASDTSRERVAMTHFIEARSLDAPGRLLTLPILKQVLIVIFGVLCFQKGHNVKKYREEVSTRWVVC